MEEYNQDDRSLLSMLIDLLVAVPERYKELENYKFPSEEKPGVLCKSLFILVKAFSRVCWGKFNLEDRWKKMEEIARRLEEEGEGIAATSLRWAVSNRRAG
jgi:hypothetical protein